MAVLVAWPCSAQAGVLSVETSTSRGDKYDPPQTTDAVRYVAGPGEINDVQGARIVDGLLTFSDRAGVTPGPGCEPVSPETVRCTVANPYNGIFASLADGDDRFVDALGGQVDGGPGDDTLEGGTVVGGPGSDVLTGALADGGPGADRIDAAAVDYRKAAVGVRVDLRLHGAGGPDGEDLLGPAVQGILGSAHDDVLVGNDGKNKLEGGGGADSITGWGGDDDLAGGDGADLILGGDGQDSIAGENDDDRIDAGSGHDTVYGGYGADRIDGAAGRDQLSGDEGADRIDGGADPDYLDGFRGADLLLSRDGVQDAVRCGPDTRVDRRSQARADGLDLVRACGRVRRAARPRPLLATVEQGPEASARAEVGCSQDVPKGCRGTLVLRVDGRVIKQRAVRLEPSVGRGYLLKVPQRTFDNATRNCGALRVKVRFTYRSGGRATAVSERTVHLQSSDPTCPRTLRPRPISVTNW